MYCKLCGKHLYEQITFLNLFKWNYKLHIECEQECLKFHGIEVFPLADKLVEYQYVIERGYEQSDTGYLFLKYMGEVFLNLIEEKKWSIIILIDDITDYSDLVLILQLGIARIRMVSLFHDFNFS